jgi:hypothetical protein
MPVADDERHGGAQGRAAVELTETGVSSGCSEALYRSGTLVRPMCPFSGGIEAEKRVRSATPCPILIARLRFPP